MQQPARVVSAWIRGSAERVWVVQACAPVQPPGSDGGVGIGGEAADADLAGVRSLTMRMIAPQQTQRITDRCSGSGRCAGVLKTSRRSSAAMRLALGCRNP